MSVCWFEEDIFIQTQESESIVSWKNILSVGSIVGDWQRFLSIASLNIKLFLLKPDNCHFIATSCQSLKSQVMYMKHLGAFLGRLI